MSSLNKSSFLKLLFSYFPVIILFLSVFNEFDFNYLKIEYFSFNFVHILIFYWTLRNPNHLGYFSIFLAGLINDVVIGISTGGTSINVINAFNIAREIGCKTIGFSGRSGGQMNECCDINIVVPAKDTARIQEMHILFGHILCHLIDLDYINKK